MNPRLEENGFSKVIVLPLEDKSATFKTKVNVVVDIVLIFTLRPTAKPSIAVLPESAPATVTVSSSPSFNFAILAVVVVQVQVPLLGKL